MFALSPNLQLFVNKFFLTKKNEDFFPLPQSFNLLLEKDVKMSYKTESLLEIADLAILLETAHFQKKSCPMHFFLFSFYFWRQTCKIYITFTTVWLPAQGCPVGYLAGGLLGGCVWRIQV